jgi:uncharacterized protein
MPTLESVRRWYPENDPVHGFDHIQRVYRMAERLALLEGADLEIVRASALLHDAEGSKTSGGEAGRLSHQYESARLARQVLLEEGWEEARIQQVEHCIRAHRFRDQREPPLTIEAQVLFDADKLDVIGAFGIARTIAFDVVVGQPIFALPSEKFISRGEKEPGEPHSSYHEYLFKLAKIKDLLFTSTARSLASGRHQFMEDFFERMLAEYAGEL